jgi:DNA-binding response OmpR family regulator
MTSTTSRSIALAGPADRRRGRLARIFEEGAYRVSCIDGTDEARRALSVAVFDVVVLVAPPVDTGEIASLCDVTTTPVLVLTSGDAGVPRALDAGAADAVALPCSRDELLARVRLALRRMRSAAVQRAMRFGGLALDLDGGSVQLAGQRLDLARLEYRLLLELMLAGGRVAPRDQLLERIWGDADRCRLNDLRVHVNRLRHKLARDGVAAPSIVSVPGVGYRLALGA